MIVSWYNMGKVVAYLLHNIREPSTAAYPKNLYYAGNANQVAVLGFLFEELFCQTKECLV